MTVSAYAPNSAAQDELRRLNRALLALSRCNQAVARATNEVELLEIICRLVVQVGGYRMAWVGYAEPDSNQTVRAMAKAGDDKGYVAGAALSWGENPEGLGPVGTAIRTGTTSVVRSNVEDPNIAFWQADIRSYGYASAAALPLMNQETAFGAINIYSAEADVFDTQELELLRELSSNLGFGILTLRARAEGQRCQAALRSELGKQRALFEQRERLENQRVQARWMLWGNLRPV